ncbi:RNA polymerase subunit sigma-70 [Methylobacterium sp. J-072]|uniref:RNA polymerase subunit sigma-70 n=1 Tax=Methylobacterium sp. J-072 TaxID=2836651 RepID=UPI001FB9925D|nr:RNA polymerase subunit sigma-70 [Methylobacterium sp. J-072]MCJ2096609.1 RNA polymerase subunit sigma-70 [Methylobacterium sp. J-072]
MATLKEFEEALREHGMNMALALLERLRERDRATRTVKPARRLTGQKMTPELARAILDLHASTGMTQQEIAFKVGVNQGRVNEVIKRGKWLSDDPQAPEAVARDKALSRMRGDPKPKKPPLAAARAKERKAAAPKAPAKARNQGQLALGDL